MKLKANIKTIIIIAIALTAVTLRLISNKNSFEHEQKLVSESAGAIPVISQSVEYKTVNGSFVADGSFSAEKEVSISSEVAGKVIAVRTETGNTVRSGQVLAILDHSVLSTQLQQAKSVLQKRMKDLIRNEALVKTDGATELQVEDSKLAVTDARTALENIQNEYNNTFIKAPFDGTITKRYIEKGSYLSQGSQLFDLNQISSLKLVVKVTGDRISLIRKGQSVSVTVDNLPAKTVNGTISAINDKAGLSKLYDVEITVGTTLNGQIKPGMFGKVTFGSKEQSKSLIIPRAAIPGSIKDAEVYIIQGETAILRKIKVMPLDEKEIIVTSGLKAGDVIAVSGQINLTNGAKVKSIK